MPVQSGLAVAQILLQIFPHIRNVEYTNSEWKVVSEIINDFRRTGAFVHRSGKKHQSHPTIHGDTLSGDAVGTLLEPEDRHALGVGHG